MTITPLPCPFCGGESITIREGSTFRWTQVECDSCGAMCGEVRGYFREVVPSHQDKVSQAAIQEWNIRAEEKLK